METAKTKWAIDPYHTEILFKVKHLVISTVTGKFEKFDASVLWLPHSFHPEWLFLYRHPKAPAMVSVLYYMELSVRFR